MQEFLSSPWPWYVAGPLFGAMIPLLLYFGNKQLGASSSLQHICKLTIPTRLSYFQYDLKEKAWQLFFMAGVVLGAVFVYFFMNNPDPVAISPQTVADLQALGITNFEGLSPVELFGSDQILSRNGLIFMVLGGLMIGFGVRYANGCTAGHGFMGLSQFAVSSLVAVLAFFAGGLIMTHLLFPLIF